MIEDNLNPYKKKRTSNTVLSHKKTDTGDSSVYWRNFSSSVEQSIKDNRSFYQQSSGQRRLSLANSNRSKETKNEGANHFGVMAAAFNQGFGQAFFKKRSATFNIPRINTDIIEEHDLEK